MKNWILNQSYYLPIEANSVCEFPKSGIFSLVEYKKTIALRFIAEKFSYSYKVYDNINKDIKEHISKVWNSPLYKNKNLGIIFNGLQGTGKTITAQTLCNELNLPVILIDSYIQGSIEFIESLEFEAVILIDEAEKIFENESEEILLRLTEGKLNKSRKLYILITNDKFSLNENLFNRPSRIRYIKEFNRISETFIDNYLEDNILDKSKKSELINYIKKDINWVTIDILKEVVLEFNITNKIPVDMLNIPKSNNKYNVLIFDNVTNNDIYKINEILKQIPKDNYKEWLNSSVSEEFLNKNKSILEIKDDIKASDLVNNFSLLSTYLNSRGYLTKTNISDFKEGAETDYGIVECVDKFGVIVSNNDLSNDNNDHYYLAVFEKFSGFNIYNRQK